MQILIELSEENYRKVEDGRCPVSVMRDAIRNGKPLPSICDLCIYNPPSSTENKPCALCVAYTRGDEDEDSD